MGRPSGKEKTTLELSRTGRAPSSAPFRTSRCFRAYGTQTQHLSDNKETGFKLNQ